LRLLRLTFLGKTQKLQRGQGDNRVFQRARHCLYSDKFNINQSIRKDSVKIGCGRTLSRKATRWMSESISPAAACVIYATEAPGKTVVTFSKLSDFSLRGKNPTLL
jgi:hypothetical protein